MKIVQKINTKDLANFNSYLLDINISYKFSIIILGALSLILGVASIVFELIKIQTVLVPTIIISTLLIIIGIFAFTGLKPLLRTLIKKRVIKKNEQIDDIRVTLSDAGLLWEFDNKPSEKEINPYTWSSIIKACEKDEYIYIHVDAYVVLFIKKDACDNIQEVTSFLKEKLANRYKNK